MKEVLEEYYKRLKEEYQEKFGTSPTVSYTDKLDKDMLISEIEEDEEIEWVIKPMPKLDLDQFPLNEELKEYFSLYRFFHLEGGIILLGKECCLAFEPLYGDANEVEKKISLMYEYAKECKNDGKYYVLGMACYDYDDGYQILYNIENGQISIWNIDLEKEIMIDMSLKDTIKKMEVLI